MEDDVYKGLFVPTGVAVMDNYTRRHAALPIGPGSKTTRGGPKAQLQASNTIPNPGRVLTTPLHHAS